MSANTGKRHGSGERRLIGTDQIKDEFVEGVSADKGGKDVHEGMDYRHVERALSGSG